MNANSDKEYIDNKVGDVRTAVDDLRTTMNERLDALRMTMDERFNALRVTMDERFNAMRVTMGERFNAIDAKIESAVAKGVAEVIKWVVGLFITLIVLTVGLSSVVMNLVLRQQAAVAQVSAPAPVVSTPAVIIQLSPQGAAVLPAAPAESKP